MMEAELFRSPELDRFAAIHHVSIQAINIFVVGPTGFLFRAETSYPLPRRLRLTPEIVKEQTLLADVHIDLAEFWFYDFQSFAVYDCSGRVPETHRLVIH